MLKRSVFFDEITVFWDRISSSEECYKIYFNGTLFSETDNTHATFSSLDSDREYDIKISVIEGGLEIALIEEKIKTAKAKAPIDITSSPYFAKGDGESLSTSPIQKAINDCKETEYVYIPEGTFLSGALDIPEGVELYLADGATLLGSQSPEDYLPKIKSRFEGGELDCYRSLINIGKLEEGRAPQKKNVIIRGKGSIIGGGAELARATIEKERAALKDHLEKNAEYVKTCENSDTIPGRVRGRLISSICADGVTVAGLTLGFAASWNLHFIYSKNILTYNAKISSRGVWNGDGWDPDSTENATIFNTEFDTHDNAIAIKSGKNPEGNKIAIPSKNINIFNCRGRCDIAIGSELSGGIDGVNVRDCHFLNSWGINIKTTAERGGFIKNVSVKDSTLASITLRTRINFNNDNEGAGCLTDVRDLHFENLTLEGVFMNGNGEASLIAPISVDGFDDSATPIENVTFKNIRILPRKDGEMQPLKCRNVKGLTLENVDFL